MAGKNKTLTQELITALAEAMYSHPSKKLACQSLGISYSTFRTWLARSETMESNPLYKELAERCAAAEARLAHDEFKDYKEATKERDSRDGKTILSFMLRRWPSISNEKEIYDEIDSKSANASNRVSLLENPPARMLAELLAHGFWRFPMDLDPADRAILIDLQHKYNTRSKLESEKPCLLTEGK